MASLKREIRDRITPIPGVEEFLRRVQRSGRHLWIVTNAHRDSWQLKLEHTGFRHYFERVISSHDFGYPKEDLRFWEAMRSRSEEHTSELQSLMRISYAVFCLKKKTKTMIKTTEAT